MKNVQKIKNAKNVFYIYATNYKVL